MGEILCFIIATLGCTLVMGQGSQTTYTSQPPSSNDCKYISSHLEEYCKDIRNWGELRGCDVHSTGVILSISWCPKVIRNNTCIDEVMLRLNHLKGRHGHQFDEGKVSLKLYPEGSATPQIDYSLHETCQAVVKYLGGMSSFLKKHLSCPLKFPKIPLFKHTGKVKNPLSNSLRPGSYHFLANVNNSINQKFLCFDAWLEIGE